MVMATTTLTSHSRLPSWIKVQFPGQPEYLKTRSILQRLRLNTVCQEARCPNVGECWENRAATFMILGDVCTRACGFCHVSKGKPKTVDSEEPLRLAQAVRELEMRHVVITSVDRDDLPDGGAGHFAKVVENIKVLNKDVTVEVLTPDFRGNKESLRKVLNSPIDVFNHNLETVPRLYRKARRGSIYERSLQVLKWAKKLRPQVLTKSGLMLGLGETFSEVFSVLKDLVNIHCDILTLGQYLRPSVEQLPVEKFLTPEEFNHFGNEARKMGFRHVESGPLVRSSYHAWKQV
ncbi:MAG: lipoyl synthase [Chlamydiae bacterium]|nr:lipoyl synthase [Chlamydiota bacterium]MBI3277032.1 lipoyl synthase [Chlamydiota bacterium]